MSDSNKPKPLPPDDFGATTPNIKIPKSDSPSFSDQPSNDWEKTNYNYSPKDLGRDEWNKTAFNVPKSTPPPPSRKEGDWGMTQANINLPSQEQQSFSGNFGESKPVYGESAVSLNVSQNESPQYQAPPSEKIEETATKKKSGIPGWIWASAGLLGMFFFTVAVLLAVYFIFLGKTGFDVVIKGPAQVRSDVYVNGSQWSVTSADGTIRLLGLKSGEEKKIEIKNPTENCQVEVIKLDEAIDGNIVKRTASCKQTSITQTPQQPQTPSEQCIPKKDDLGESARKCAITELDKLEKAGTWTVEQLLYAMNLYIINFAKNDATIKPADMQFIERAAGFMKKLPPNTVVEVGGHTDSDSDDNYNMKLSDKRATSVRNALVSKGVNSTMLRTKPYGETQPKYDNGTEDGKFGNRRIEYKQVG